MLPCTCLPRYSSSLHFVGHSDVCGPDVILPAFLTQHSPQDRTTVHTNPHVNICLGFLSDIPAVGLQSNHIQYKTARTTTNHKSSSFKSLIAMTPQTHCHLGHQGTPYERKSIHAHLSAVHTMSESSR